MLLISVMLKKERRREKGKGKTDSVSLTDVLRGKRLT